METETEWPFSAWLKLAVVRFGLTPSAFWEMSFQDWLVLTRAEPSPAMSAQELCALSLQFPDVAAPHEGSPDEVRYDTD